MAPPCAAGITSNQRLCDLELLLSPQQVRLPPLACDLSVISPSAFKDLFRPHSKVPMELLYLVLMRADRPSFCNLRAASRLAQTTSSEFITTLRSDSEHCLQLLECSPRSFPNVKRLIFENCSKYSGKHVAALLQEHDANLPALESLECIRLSGDVHDLLQQLQARAGTFTGLRLSLNQHCSEDTFLPATLQSLCRLSHLTSLHLTGCTRLNAAHLQPLALLRQLQSLTLEHCFGGRHCCKGCQHLTFEALVAAVNKLPELEQLSLSSPSMHEPVDMSSRLRLPKLGRLSLRVEWALMPLCFLDTPQLAASLTHLEYGCHLAACKPEEFSADPDPASGHHHVLLDTAVLARLTCLQSVSLIGAPLHSLAPLAHLPHLASLHLHTLPHHHSLNPAAHNHQHHQHHNHAAAARGAAAPVAGGRQGELACLQQLVLGYPRTHSEVNLGDSLRTAQVSQLRSLLCWAGIGDGAGLSALAPRLAPGLRHLLLSAAHAPTLTLKRLTALTGLHSLELHHLSAAADPGLHAVASLTGLTRLALVDSWAAPRDMAALAALTGLQTLLLCNLPQMTDAGLAPLLSRLHRLQHLRLCHMPHVSGQVLDHLPRTAPLTHLTLDSLLATYLDDPCSPKATTPSASSHSPLHALSTGSSFGSRPPPEPLDGRAPRAMDYSLLTNQACWGKLEEVQLVRLPWLTDAGVMAFHSTRSLRVLRLLRCHAVSDLSVAALAKLPGLMSLDVHDCRGTTLDACCHALVDLIHRPQLRLDWKPFADLPNYNTQLLPVCE